MVLAKEPGKSKLLDFKSDRKKLRMHLIVCGAFALLVTIVTAVIGEVRVYDWLRDLMQAHYSVERFLRLFSSYGNYVFYLIFFVTGVYGLAARKRQLFHYMLAYIVVQLVSAVLITRVLKIAVGRPRPGDRGPSGLPTGKRGISFPSGHTSDMACSSSVLSYFLSVIVLRVLLYLCVVLMGLSRICVGSHYPYDVIAGAFIGLFGGYIISHFFAMFFLPRKDSLKGNDEKKVLESD
jgi:undecaprenyl-diphosphatase